MPIYRRSPFYLDSVIVEARVDDVTATATGSRSRTKGNVQGVIIEDGGGASVIALADGVSSQAKTVGVGVITPGPITPGPNLPAGMTFFNNGAFDNDDGAQMISQGWTWLNVPSDMHRETSPTAPNDTATNPTLVTDANFPNPTVLQNIWPQDFGDDARWPGSKGRSGGTRVFYRDGGVTPKEFYCSFRLRLDPSSFNVAPTGYKVVGFMINRNGGSQLLWLMCSTSNNRLNFDQKIYQNTGQHPSSPRIIQSNPTKNLTGGVVYWIEVYVKVNDSPALPGSAGANGIIRLWVDDVQHLNVSDVTFYTEGGTSADHVNGFKIDPIPSLRVPANRNFVRYDDVYLAVR